MRLEHVALWTDDLERARRFYETYFAAHAGELYRNPHTRFQSYFLSFATGARLELMHRADIARPPPAPETESIGLAHFAVALGSEAAVDQLTERFRRDGLRVLSAPRRTGDGYYESVVLDPDGNRLELTV
ncbi:MAG: glyoxalase [Opitutus sp.]|nr:glyoxalase [Opitutus sp.]